jgi:hypothetical protein
MTAAKRIEDMDPRELLDYHAALSQNAPGGGGLVEERIRNTLAVRLAPSCRTRRRRRW